MSGEIYRFSVGRFQCIAIADVQGADSYRGMYSNASDEVLEEAARVLGYDPDRVPFPCTPMVVDTGTQRILIDTGNEQGSGEEDGHLLIGLQNAGIDPGDIDLILITHGHGDHVHGLTDANGALHYPNARCVTWKIDRDHFMSDGAFPPGQEARRDLRRAKFNAIADRLTLLEAETEVAPGIRMVPMPGHTPGHSGVLLESEGERLLHIADTIHTPMQAGHPEWYFVADSGPDTAVATRREWFARAAREHLLTAAYHLPFPGLGYMVPAGDAWTWKPREA